jgi:hypothetical protein
MMKADSQQLAPRVQPREPGAFDSFVFFGATGDLAYKQIFPPLQQMSRMGWEAKLHDQQGKDTVEPLECPGILQQGSLFNSPFGFFCG